MLPTLKITTAGEQITLDYTEPSDKVSKAAGGLVCASLSAQGNVAKYGCDRVFTKIPWSAVHPSPNAFDWSSFQSALDANKAVKHSLRIQAGGTAPAWLKTDTGTITCVNAARGLTAECAKWWTADARNAWRNMITAAGAKYDNNPQVVMVSADLPMTVYSEPYILGGDKNTGIALFNAGLTQAVQVDTIKWCVDVTAAAFPNTLVELAIHSDLQYPTATGIGYSWPVGRTLALDLARKHGKHLLLSDYGLGVGDTLAAHTPTGSLSTESDVYAWMYLRAHTTGPERGPIGFQLTPRGQTAPADYVAMGNNSVALGAISNETSGWASAGSACSTIDAALKANEAVG